MTRENLRLLDAERDCVDTNTLLADNIPSFSDTFACAGGTSTACSGDNVEEQLIAHLASAPLSCPLILVSQSAHLHKLLPSDEAPFDAAIGHSQGTAAAIVATSHRSMDASSITTSAHEYSRCLLWTGIRAQAAMTHSVALQLPVSCAARGEEHLNPICMAAVSKVNLIHLRDIIEQFNTAMPASLRVGVLLQNTEDDFVVGGSPVGIVAFRDWLTEQGEPTGDNFGVNCRQTSQNS